MFSYFIFLLFLDGAFSFFINFFAIESMGVRKRLDCTLKMLRLQVAVFICIGLLKIERSKVAAFNTSSSRDIFNAASFHLLAT